MLKYSSRSGLKIVVSRSLHFESATRFGYQFSPFASTEADCMMLERSLRKGCSVFVGDFSRCSKQFEHLADISAIDEINLDSHIIGNCLTQTADINEQVASLMKAFRGRPLDFVTVPLEMHGKESRGEEMFSTLSNLKLSYQTKVGVEVSNNTLQQNAPPSQIISQLESIHKTMPLDVLMCASNSFTTHISPIIIHWAKSNNIPCIASDILRGHPRSPGTVISPLLGLSSLATDKLPTLPIDEAIEHLKKCFDASIRIEKTFLEKYKEQTKLLEQQGEITTTTEEEGLVMPHLLLGMTLASTQDKFLFVEEWKYVLLNQIEPNFEKAVATLEKTREGQQTDDFLKLYQPMRRNLIKSFECTMNARQELFAGSVKAAAIKESQGQKGADQLTDGPLHQGLGKAWLQMGASVAVLAGVEVESEKWAKELEDFASREGSAECDDMSAAGLYIEGAATCVLASKLI